MAVRPLLKADQQPAKLSHLKYTLVERTEQMIAFRLEAYCVARRVFYSFHYQLDNWRVQQIRNIGAIEGQSFLSSNQWEDVAKGGDAAIRAWIDEQMKGKSCNVVLIGSNTAGRRWVNYEFTKAWGDRKGVLGVHIHRLEDRSGDPRPREPIPSEGSRSRIATDARSRLIRLFQCTILPGSRVEMSTTPSRLTLNAGWKTRSLSAASGEHVF